MAIKKVRLPDNTTQDINDARVVSDAIAYIGAESGSATYVDGQTVIDVTTKADKVNGATNGNFAALDANGNLSDSGHKHSDYQAALVSGTNIKTVNNQSLLGSGNITISGGSGGGEENVIDAITFNGAAVPVTNKTAAITADIPDEVTESTVSGWGFTKNTGTYSKPSGGIPKTDLATAVQTSLGKADTALQSYTETDPVFAASAAHGITSADITNWNSKTSNVGTITGITMNGSSKGTSGVVDLGTVLTSFTETDPTVPAWAKASSKPTYTASEVGALPSTTTIPSKTSDLTNDSGFAKITISSSEPTSSQGSNGDVWIVI